MIPLVADKLDELAELCRRYNVKRLDLFGSAVSGDFEPGRSDLDFVVVFGTSTPAEHGDCYLDLLDALEELFQCSVDLLEWSAITNSYLRRAIDDERELLYAA